MPTVRTSAARPRPRITAAANAPQPGLPKRGWPQPPPASPGGEPCCGQALHEEAHEDGSPRREICLGPLRCESFVAGVFVRYRSPAGAEGHHVWAARRGPCVQAGHSGGAGGRDCTMATKWPRSSGRGTARPECPLGGPAGQRGSPPRAGGSPHRENRDKAQRGQFWPPATQQSRTGPRRLSRPVCGLRRCATASSRDAPSWVPGWSFYARSPLPPPLGPWPPVQSPRLEDAR